MASTNSLEERLNMESFSQRHGLDQPVNLLATDEVPGLVREDFIGSVKYFVVQSVPDLDLQVRFAHELYLRMRGLIWETLGSKPPGSPIGGPWAKYIPQTINECKWHEFYDVCEWVPVLFREVTQVRNTQPFLNSVNSRFRHHGLAWKYNENGIIVRSFPEILSQSIDKAKASLVANPKFHEADKQFSEAVAYLDRRDDPDYDTVVVKSSGALEVILKVILDQQNNLSQLLKQPLLKDKVHPILLIVIEKVAAFRGDQAAHPMPKGSIIGREEAEFIVSLTANCIIYLAEKFPN